MAAKDLQGFRLAEVILSPFDSLRIGEGDDALSCYPILGACRLGQVGSSPAFLMREVFSRLLAIEGGPAEMVIGVAEAVVDAADKTGSRGVVELAVDGLAHGVPLS